MPNSKQRLLANIFSLSTLQIFNYILPLITLPYLVRVLGVEQFGLLAFATASVTYLNILSDYGFNLSATKEISLHKESPQKLALILSSAMSVKALLMLFSFVLLTFLIAGFEKFAAERELFYITFLIVFGQMLFPLWLFQGLQQMHYIAYLNLFAKSFFTVCIFVFVHEPSDYLLAALLSSLGFVAAGLGAQYVIYWRLHLRYVWVGPRQIVQTFQEGWHIFVGTAGISFYKNNAIVILGIFADNATVGYFSLAKRVVDALNQFAALISQSIYPQVCREITSSSIQAKKLLQKSTLSIVLFTLGAAAVLFWQGEFIVELIAGEPHREALLALQIMALVPFFIGINVPAVQLLLATSNNRAFSRALIGGALLDVALNFSLVPYYSFVGSSITVVLSELFVTLALYYQVYRLQLLRSLS